MKERKKERKERKKSIVLNTIDISFHPTEPQQLKLIYFLGDKDSACLFRESNLGTRDCIQALELQIEKLKGGI